jgi:hypothetical protein
MSGYTIQYENGHFQRRPSCLGTPPSMKMVIFRRVAHELAFATTNENMAIFRRESLMNWRSPPPMKIWLFSGEW